MSNDAEQEEYDYKWGFSEPELQAKRPLIIERPNGLIPGLIEVNTMLAEKFGCVVVLCTERVDEHGNWIVNNIELHKARIKDNQISPYEVIKS